MAVKLTKNELKVQKDRLKQFQRYLPTLQLKKQQLQSVVMQVTAQLEQVEQQRRAAVAGLDDWVAVFAENDSFPADKRLETLIRPHHVVCGEENIAGVTVPVFQELSFEEIQYDVADYPLWVDTAQPCACGRSPGWTLGKDPPPPGGAFWSRSCAPRPSG